MVLKTVSSGLLPERAASVLPSTQKNISVVGSESVQNLRCLPVLCQSTLGKKKIFLPKQIRGSNNNKTYNNNQ